MPPTYPCVQCLFCKQLFATAKSLNSHLDHYIPEYCEATGAAPRRTAQGSHPIAAIRSVRADATRTHHIRWKRDTVRPPDGVLWSFAVAVPSKAVKVANSRGGLKSADWWLKYLRAIPIPPSPEEDDDEDDNDDDEELEDDDTTSVPSDSDLPPPLPPKKPQRERVGVHLSAVAESSRDGAARGAVSGDASQHTRSSFPGATVGGFDANGGGNLTVNIAGKTVGGTEIRAPHHGPDAKSKGKAKASPPSEPGSDTVEPLAPPTAPEPDNRDSKATATAPLHIIDLITPTPSPVPRSPAAWRIKTPPRHAVHFKTSRRSCSPFLLPSAPPVLFTLRIAFLADVYCVPVSRGTSLADALGSVKARNTAFDSAMWTLLGLAPRDTGALWSVRQWEELKASAMYAEDEVTLDAVVVKL